MCNLAQYFWQFSNKFGRFSGYLDAVDPRDAVSRVMTQDIARTGMLFGQEYSVPLEVIDAAPGNAGCLVYHTVQRDYSIRVQRLA
ncbi:hypothetical protein G3A43_07420 [Paraburkholderia aspalathi]|nr:hypothetical protein [Paraburkholderia aspalathi]MBK3780083.1 hypothetical protein [Paraburkholderia aspalathi]